MGKIFDYFESVNYENEADVNHRFVIPLLTKFLCYSLEDIFPERNYPAKDLYYGRKSTSSEKLPTSQRPDFVVCIDDISNPKFVLESKAPGEDLEKHLKQMKSYAIGVGINFIVITNGKSLRIYDVNEKIFEANDIAELDIRFDYVEKILSKEVHLRSTSSHILQGIDLDKSLGISVEQIADEEKRKIDLEISDFKVYLEHLEEEFTDWQVPREFHSLYDSEIVQYPPNKLHKFRIYESSKIDSSDQKEYSFEEIEQKFRNPKVIFGESGIGKTTLLKYLVYSKATLCLKSLSSQIPVYVPLRQFGLNISLKSLIIDSLGNRGFTVKQDQFYDVLQKYSFIFLLDAYDEVQEQYLQDAKREIEQFIAINKHDVYITSRVSRPLLLPRLSPFIIKPLEQNEVDDFVEKYLGDAKFKFLMEIRNNRLIEESKNTFLLTLMILIYKADSYIPSTRNQIIKRTIEKIKEWEQSKGERLTNGLTWEIKEQLFSKLAFTIINSNRKSNLSIDEIDDVILPLIEEYEEKREISKGVDKHRILSDLCLTGIVSYNSNHLTFWHNIFLDYFASKELASLYITNPEFIEEIKDQVLWESIIIGSVVHMDDSTKLINVLKENNLFLASECLIESRVVDESTIKNIVSQLEERCSSSLTSIRSRALYYLSTIDSKYTTELFFDLVEKETYPEVKLVALEEISKLKTDRAKAIVYKYIDWDLKVSLSHHSTSQGTIAKALSNFDEDEHLIILDILKTKSDIFTSLDCKEAILNIYRSGKLTEKVKKKLLDLYIEKPASEDEMFMHPTGILSEILIEINDDDDIPILIKNIDKNDLGLYNLYTEDILASYQSKEAIALLVDEILKEDNETKIIEVCSDALSRSKGIVPLEVFTQLLDNENHIVRRNAVKGLGRFSSAEIGSLLSEHFNDKSPLVQGEIIEILGDKGLLVELLQLEFKLLNVEVLLEVIRKYKLKEMIPIVNWLKDKVSNDDRLLVNMVHTFCVLEEAEKAKSIVNEIFREDGILISEYGLADLAKIAPSFDAPYSLKIVEHVLSSIEQFEHRNGTLFWEDLCIEALEKISSKESLELLKKLAETYASKNSSSMVERSCRSINRLATNNDEDWYINFISSNTNLEKIGLRRAIEGIGYVGSQKSLSIIKEIAELNKDNAYIYNACFLSIENIYRNEGISTEIRETDLLIQ